MLSRDYKKYFCSVIPRVKTKKKNGLHTPNSAKFVSLHRNSKFSNMKKKYLSSSLGCARPLVCDIDTSASKIKSDREDFRDLFTAEHSYRLEHGYKSIVYCLTWNDEHVHYKYGRNVLHAPDLDRYSKSSAFAKRLKRLFGVTYNYVCVGELGCGGETHEKKSTRGYGNNPHYHCVGWYNVPTKISNIKSVIDLLKEIHFLNPDYFYDPKQVDETNYNLVTEKYILDNFDSIFCSYLVYSWQGNLEPDILKYGRSKILRSQGLGHVELSGEIITAVGGSSYISKYMGKDMFNMYKGLYYKKMLHELAHYLTSSLTEKFEELGHHYTYRSILPFINMWLHNTNNTFVNSSLNPIIRKYFDYKYNDEYSLLAIKVQSHFNEIIDILDYHYTIFMEDYLLGLNTDMSPKLRKFHGFGRNLLKDADLEKGTYTIHYSDKVVERNLPPSLKRYVYYDYNVCINDRGDKVVLYSLNNTGRRYIDCTTQRAEHLMNVTYKSIFGINPNIVPAVRYIVYLSKFDISQTQFDDTFFCHCLFDPERSAALNWLFSCYRPSPHNSNIHWEPRTFIDIESYMRDTYPDVYEYVLKIRKHLTQKAIVKNLKDLDFITSWHNVYNFNY